MESSKRRSLPPRSTWGKVVLGLVLFLGSGKLATLLALPVLLATGSEGEGRGVVLTVNVVAVILSLVGIWYFVLAARQAWKNRKARVQTSTIGPKT